MRSWTFFSLRRSRASAACATALTAGCQRTPLAAARPARPARATRSASSTVFRPGRLGLNDGKLTCFAGLVVEAQLSKRGKSKSKPKLLPSRKARLLLELRASARLCCRGRALTTRTWRLTLSLPTWRTRLGLTTRVVRVDRKLT